MKYLLIFLIVLSFIAPSTKNDDSFKNIFRDGFYNYITCLDNSVDYLVENVPAFSSIAEMPYEKAYASIMKDRHLIKHLVSSGETLDDIIKLYNGNIDNIENFRKVIYKENEGLISEDYQVQSGSYIAVPCE